MGHCLIDKKKNERRSEEWGGKFTIYLKGFPNRYRKDLPGTIYPRSFIIVGEFVVIFKGIIYGCVLVFECKLLLRCRCFSCPRFSLCYIEKTKRCKLWLMNPIFFSLIKRKWFCYLCNKYAILTVILLQLFCQFVLKLM